MKRGELIQSPGATGWTIYVRDDDTLHVLNETARAIWELCDGETTPDEMGRAVAELTGMSVTGAIDEVKTTLADLAERGLVTND